MRKLLMMAAMVAVLTMGAAAVAGALNWQGDGDGERKFGTTGRDLLDGRGGDDYLDARGGRDFVLGGHGNDVLIGGRGDDRTHGGPGNDKVYTGTKTEGEKDDDEFSCGKGHDVLFYGEGDKPDSDERGGCEVFKKY